MQWLVQTQGRNGSVWDGEIGAMPKEWKSFLQGFNVRYTRRVLPNVCFIFGCLSEHWVQSPEL